MLHNHPNLQYFGNGTISYDFTGSDGGEMLLLPLLLRDSPLKHLDLSNRGLKDDNLRMFVNVFTKYPEMAPNELNLSDSIFENTEILPKIVSMERIININLSCHKWWNSDWMVHVAESITLRSIPLELLNLGDTQLGDIDIARMMESFKEAPNMLPKYLILSKNNFGLSGACSIAEVLSLVEYPLLHLNLSETQIGYVGENARIEPINNLCKNSFYNVDW